MATSVIVGGSGSGRSTMLAARVSRLASLGTRVAVVAPYWSGNGWFRGAGGRVIRIGPTSTWHHDPLALRGRLPDERADDLRPLFSALLGPRFDPLADEVLRAALLEFFATGEEGMAGFVSTLMRMERNMTPVARTKRDDLVTTLETMTLRGPLARYFTLPSDPLPDEGVRRLLVHPEPVSDATERALLACLALSVAIDTLSAGPGPGALLVDDTDVLLGMAPDAVDDALIGYTRIGRRHDLSLSMVMTLASPNRPGWKTPRILALTGSWIFLPADPEIVRGWARVLPHTVDPRLLVDALAPKGDERRAAIVENGIVRALRPVLLPGEEDILAGSSF